MVELVSPGGCGTFFMRDVVLRENYNKFFEAEKANTHRPNPNMPPNFKGKIIYLYSNPYNMILSFFKRGFLKSPYLHCKYIGGNLAEISKKEEWKLQEYLENGIDFFNLEKHFHNWFEFSQRNYEIMFVKYEFLQYSIEKILDWYGLPDRIDYFKSNFRKRKSNWTNQKIEIIEGLYKIYGSHKEFLDGLAEIEIFGR